MALGKAIRQKLPGLALWFILAAMLTTMVIYHPWSGSKSGEGGVIEWDVISYYSYLPATFIYGDVTLGFLDDKDFKYYAKFWPVELEDGNRLILTSMGLSVLYSPFFSWRTGLHHWWGIPGMVLTQPISCS